jgi:ditrans,polycis-polyprenyl diphosphate synthase
MSGPLASLYNRLRDLITTCLLYILSLGPIPRHVGFVMDGNRRYARERGRKVAEGHGKGFESLKRVRPALCSPALRVPTGPQLNTQILEICLRLNIRAVSIYAFAIDNFSRPKDEVDAIMSLAKTSLLDLCREG